MLLESKSDRLLLHNFNFDGQPKRYLVELSFVEARVIFMLRCRMFPTKNNFQYFYFSLCLIILLHTDLWPFGIFSTGSSVNLFIPMNLFVPSFATNRHTLLSLIVVGAVGE